MEYSGLKSPHFLQIHPIHRTDFTDSRLLGGFSVSILFVIFLYRAVDKTDFFQLFVRTLNTSHFYFDFTSVTRPIGHRTESTIKHVYYVDRQSSRHLSCTY